MKVYKGLHEIKKPFYRPALTIGNFDGVHLGHQALFRRVVELAGPRNGATAALTFEPHPMKVLRPQNPPKLISTMDHKVELIAEAGIEHLICLPFTKELAGTSAHDFVNKILYQTIGMEDLVVGYDYAFGKGRQGNISLLQAMGSKLGFKVHVVSPVSVEGMVVSSTNVREYVTLGEMKKVRLLLGRYYQIHGIVQEGIRRGGPVVGFPTANLRIDKEDLCPKPGVYVVQVIHQDQCYGGVMNIGYNPTFGGQDLGAEVHIFDFEKNIYGHSIKLDFIQRLRDEKKFSGPKELAGQITKDAEAARLVLSRVKGNM
ncbi:MAG: bifunctional riboflavin kinase/FAD synthetase [Thermodesulfobacteriota bacterium]|nr:bifunctional riboflavin kinase/FAD synthetase [Thermodesulfobacteriota bacterium]